MTPAASAGARPRLSVVVPSHDRCDQLRRTLEALGGQTLPAERFEVVVALDGPTDGSEAMLEGQAWPFTLRHRTLLPGRGAAAARNTGAALAGGDILVFLDDDIEAAPAFLEAHARAHEDGGDDAVVIGYSKPVLAREDGWFEQSLRSWWEDLFSEMGRDGHRFAYTDLLSGNFSLRRDRFERAGGFDESFACREDYELGWRLIRAGARLRFCREALGLHRDRSTIARSMARAEREGEADALLARLHPELVSTLQLSHLGGSPLRAWLLRQIVFGWPRAGDAARNVTLRLLPSLESVNARAPWRALHRLARSHAYARGVATALGREENHAALLREAWWSSSSRPPKLATLDLAQGLVGMGERVSRERPDGLVVTCDGREVGRLEPSPGAEPLDAKHLRAFLASHPDRWVTHVEAARALGKPSPTAEADPTARRAAAASPIQTEYRPILVGELDIETWRFVPPLSEMTFPARLVVRRGRTPLWWVWLDALAKGEDRLERVRLAVTHHAGTALVRDSLVRALGPRDEAPPPAVGVTVVVCTRDRTENLRRCLAAIERIEYPDHEVVVVDNAPRSDETERLVRSLPWARYVREDRPGLDWARNRGVAAATRDVVAFTDDDAAPDRLWLWGFARAFAQPDVMAATGLVAPMKLDTPAQRYFEDVYGGMGKGFRPRWFRRSEMGPSDLLWASACGLGANMAFRRSLFAQAGLFDPALDVGTAARGGGDIEFFHRVVAAGHTLLYEPSALVWHEHRATMEGLRRQLADNGCAFAAYLMTCARRRTVPRAAIVRFAVADWIIPWLLRRLLKPGQHQRGLVLAEIGGMLQAPAAYRNAQREAERLGRSHEREPPPSSSCAITYPEQPA